MQLYFVFRAKEGHGQVAACSKCRAAARLVTGTRKYERGLSRLMHDELHWLVIPQQVQYKLAVTVHRCLWHQAPRYLVDYCVPVSEVPGRQPLRCPVLVAYHGMRRAWPVACAWPWIQIPWLAR